MSAVDDRTAELLEPGSLEAATNVLIVGPAMTGKRQLLLDLIGGAPDRAAILVTTKRSAAQIKGEFGAGRDLSRWRLGIVDCVTRQRAVGPVAETPEVEYVSSAADLTGMGITTSGWMQTFYHDRQRNLARLGFHSLSTLLMYADLRRVYQFVHVVTGRVQSSGFGGVFSLDRAPGDEETVARLTQLFDSIVEVREDPRELRVRGGDFGPADWTSF